MLRSKNIVPIFTLISGLLFVITGIFFYINQDIPSYSNTVESEAYIIDYKKINGKNYPLIAFLPLNSKDTVYFISQKHNLLTGSQKKLLIKYDANNPKNVYIYDSYNEYGIPISLFVIGFGLIFLFVFLQKYGVNE